MHGERGFVRRVGREFVRALGFGACKGALQVCTCEALFTHHAAGQHLLPSEFGRVFIHAFLRTFGTGAGHGPGNATGGSRLFMRQGDRRRRQEDGFVDRLGRHRARLDAMHVGGFVIAKRRGLKAVNLNIVFGGQARVLVCKLGQDGGAHLGAKQGLFVVQQLGR